MKTGVFAAWRRTAAVILAILATAAGLSLYWSRHREREREFAAQVRTALAERQWDQASAQVDRWQKEYPRSSEARYLRARAEIGRERYQEAVNALGQALDLGYAPSILRRLRAAIQIRTATDDGSAIPILEEALRDPGEILPEIAEALVLHHHGRFQFARAEAVLTQWKQTSPNDPRPYWHQARIDLKTQIDPAVLIRDYRSALDRAPDWDAPRLGLADALRKSLRNDEALVEYKAYLKNHPDSPVALAGAGECAVAVSDLEQANVWLDRAIELNPKLVEARLARANSDFRRGNWEQTIKGLQELLRIDPYDADAYYLLSLSLKHQNQNAEAERSRLEAERLRKEFADLEEMRKELLNHPNDRRTLLKIAQWLFDHGREEEGLEMTSQVLKSDPGHKETHRLLMNHYQKKGNLGEANFHKFQLGEN